jgi:hypothetical protein
MSDYLFELFLRRRQSRKSEYVFPGRSKAGHYSGPQNPIHVVIENAKIPPFTSHSLRIRSDEHLPRQLTRSATTCAR